MRLRRWEFKFRRQVLDDRDYKEMDWKISKYENPWRFGGTSRLSAEVLLSLADWDLSWFIIKFQRGTYASSGLSLQFLWISNGLLPHGLLYLALTHPASSKHKVHVPPKYHQVSGFTEDLRGLWEKSRFTQYTWLPGFRSSPPSTQLHFGKRATSNHLVHGGARTPGRILSAERLSKPVPVRTETSSYPSSDSA